MKSIEQFLWKKLKLIINTEKNEVVRSNHHTFLGYKFYGIKSLSIAQKSIDLLKDKFRLDLFPIMGYNYIINYLIRLRI